MFNVSGKKDPGIPNRFPFKEEILKEAEKRKQQVCNILLWCYIFCSSIY